MRHEGDVDTNCNNCGRKNTQSLIKELEDIKNKGQLETI